MQLDPVAVPEPVLGYYGPLDAGSMDRAGEAFALGAYYELPARTGAVGTAVRPRMRGRAAITAALKHRGVLPIRHEFATCLGPARTGGNCLLEGRARSTDDGRVVAAFIVAVRWDVAGRITSFRAFAGPAEPLVADQPSEFVPTEELERERHRLSIGMRSDSAGLRVECAVSTRFGLLGRSRLVLVLH